MPDADLVTRLIAAAMALLALSCAPPPPPPTATPPSPSRRPVVWQATKPEDLLGVWVDYGCWHWAMATPSDSPRTEGYWYQFREDGTYRVAFQTNPSSDSRVQALKDLESAPRIEGVYWFEGGRLRLKISKSVGALAFDCLDSEASYEVRVVKFFGKVSIKLYEIAEPCEARAGQLGILYMLYR